MDRQKILKYLEKKGLYNDNSSKILYTYTSGGKYIASFRDRQPDQSYFLVKVKGSGIYAYRIRYENQQGRGINTFIELEIPTMIGEEIDLPILKNILILKMGLKHYKKFIPEFRQLTPSLNWFLEKQ